MFTSLLAVMLVSVCPFVSANPCAGLTLASLTPQLQQCTQAAIPLTIDAGVPHRSLVVEQDISDAASASSTSAIGPDVQPSGGSDEQCTDGTPITLDNIKSRCQDWHDFPNLSGFDDGFQSEILQPIQANNLVLHQPPLTSVKGQCKPSTYATGFQKLMTLVTVLWFLVCWFGVGTLCYVVGNSFPSSFAAASVKRCSAVLEITCDQVDGGPSRMQQLNASLSKEWRDKWKRKRLFSLVRKPAKQSMLAILLRMRDLCVSALDIVVASIRWLYNRCREAWQNMQDRQSGK